MRVLVVHNQYQQSGGEDVVFRAESALLEAHGHTVERFTAHNNALTTMGALRSAQMMLWNRGAGDALRETIRKFRPDLMHVHNTFPLLSPAIYHVAHAERVPIVQTVHNYRLACPNALFYRRGGPCEDCLGKAVPWPGILHGCYRGRVGSAGVAAMLTLHRALGTWARKVDCFIAPSSFTRKKLIAAGIPADRIVVKPHFVSDPGVGPGDGDYALFVGRLSTEKGITTLTTAWWEQQGRRLLIVGDGPMVEVAWDAVDHIPGVEWRGRQRPDQVLALMRRATMLIVPSRCYETFGRVVAEAFACGTPVIAADIGALAEMVEDGQTGLRFRPSDYDDLAAKIRWAWEHPAEWQAMRPRARAAYESRYTADANYRALLAIYETAAARVPA